LWRRLQTGFTPSKQHQQQFSYWSPDNDWHKKYLTISSWNKLEMKKVAIADKFSFSWTVLRRWNKLTASCVTTQWLSSFAFLWKNVVYIISILMILQMKKKQEDCSRKSLHFFCFLNNFFKPFQIWLSATFRNKSRLSSSRRIN